MLYKQSSWEKKWVKSLMSRRSRKMVCRSLQVTTSNPSGVHLSFSVVGFAFFFGVSSCFVGKIPVCTAPFRQWCFFLWSQEACCGWLLWWFVVIHGCVGQWVLVSLFVFNGKEHRNPPVNSIPLPSLLLFTKEISWSPLPKSSEATQFSLVFCCNFVLSAYYVFSLWIPLFSLTI